MVLAYVDQNFLINCANSVVFHDQVLQLERAGRARYVLSPWHFYEIGKLDQARGEQLLRIAESLNAEWILDRSNLEVGEFLAAWSSFYGFRSEPFHPIGSLAEVGSALLRVPSRRLAQLTLRDYVKVFRYAARKTYLPCLMISRPSPGRTKPRRGVDC